MILTLALSQMMVKAYFMQLRRLHNIKEVMGQVRCHFHILKNSQKRKDYKYPKKFTQIPTIIEKNEKSVPIIQYPINVHSFTNSEKKRKIT